MRSGRRSRSSSSNPMKLVIPAALYGAARGYISNAITPLTSKIPLGQYTDEVVLGLAGYVAAKKGRGIVKQIGTSMLLIEAASLGKQAVGGMGGSTSGSSTSFNAWN
jgi:hypothetical protein